MKFSIIVPSFNQHLYIEETILNLISIKELCAESGTAIELILVDNNSSEPTKSIIQKYQQKFDTVIIESDLGQYDAINKGIKKVTGTYWTWLNTDDLLDETGFLNLIEVIKQNPEIDYIYGGVNYIDEQSQFIKSFDAYTINLDTLVSKDPAVFQPGSFFKTAFTNKIKDLKPYRCCFDYEYVLRCFKNNAVVYHCNFSVSKFRFYNQSKTGSLTPVFIKEQLEISKIYGRKWYDFLTWFSYLRLVKHSLFPRK
jgi:glycosyltransferase involved in cell wall biosynthesis